MTGAAGVAEAHAALRTELGRLGRVIVAFSGGVDSALLAKVAHDTLGPARSLSVTAVSPSLASDELEHCARTAQQWGLRWRTVVTAELDDPAYVANGPDRCYHCKNALMTALEPVAAAEGGATVVLGVNVDDLADHRPGQVAASRMGAVFPMVAAGLGKSDVRALSRHLGLSTWDKPAQACLASRLPEATPVTLGALASVEHAEAALRRMGFAEVRVRHYGDVARVELGRDELARAVRLRDEVVAAVKQGGYGYVTLDLEGFRSGNLARRPASGRPTSVRVRSGLARSDHAGSGRAGSGRAGQGRAGSGRAGQGRARSERAEGHE